ncbi:MAG TPA: hypothetical protein VK720_15515 [Terracidiphilus sp.]|nr:hypothetical protein [Terracidiphilus sp.]
MISGKCQALKKQLLTTRLLTKPHFEDATRSWHIAAGSVEFTSAKILGLH